MSTSTTTADLAVDVVSWRARACLSGSQLAVVAIALLAAVLPLLAVDLPPLVDLPNNVARAHIRAQLGHDPFYDALFVRNSMLVPNAAFDLFCAVFGGLLSPWACGHLFAVLAVLVTVGGALALASAAGASLPVAALGAALLAHNYSLTWGFLNYQFGVGLALFGAALWLRLRDRGAWARVLAPSALSLLLFFCHVLPLALYGLLVFAVELELALRRRSTGIVVRGALAGVQFVVPALLFVLESPTRGELSELPPFDLLAALRGCLKGLHAGLGGLEYAHAAALLTLLVLLWRVGRARIAPGLVLPVVALCGLSLLVPDHTASASCLQQRLPVVAAFVLVAAWRMPSDLSRAMRWLAVAAGAVLAVRTVALMSAYRERSARLDEARAVLAAVPEGAVLYTFTGPLDQADPWAKYRAPLRHAACLAALDRHVVLPQLLVSALHHTVAPSNPTVAELNQHFMVHGTVATSAQLRAELGALLGILAEPASPATETAANRPIYVAAVLFPADFVFPTDLLDVVGRGEHLTLLRVR